MKTVLLLLVSLKLGLVQSLTWISLNGKNLTSDAVNGMNDSGTVEIACTTRLPTGKYARGLAIYKLQNYSAASAADRMWYPFFSYPATYPSMNFGPSFQDYRYTYTVTHDTVDLITTTIYIKPAYAEDTGLYYCNRTFFAGASRDIYELSDTLNLQYYRGPYAEYFLIWPLDPLTNMAGEREYTSKFTRTGTRVINVKDAVLCRISCLIEGVNGAVTASMTVSGIDVTTQAQVINRQKLDPINIPARRTFYTNLELQYIVNVSTICDNPTISCEAYYTEYPHFYISSVEEIIASKACPNTAMLLLSSEMRLQPSIAFVILASTFTTSKIVYQRAS